MAQEDQHKSKPRGWKQILVHEIVEYFFNFAFLAALLIAFTWYRRLLLAEYNIQYLAYWAPVIEAAILAKLIMIGDVMRLGKRLQNKALAVVTLYRTSVFSVFVAVFSLAEHLVGALVHKKTLAEGIAEIANKGKYEILARCIVILAAFVPFFTMKEIERAFGAERIRTMFFRRPENWETSKEGSNVQ